LEKASNGQEGGLPQTPAGRLIKVSPRPAIVQPRQKFQKRRNSQANSAEDTLPGSPAIQANISITLDKDTPREYWDRVLALLGEREKASALQEFEENGRQPEAQQESLE
jgi:hypothetical protein